MQATKHAILRGNQLFKLDQFGQLVHEDVMHPADLNGLCGMAYRLGLTHLWLAHDDPMTDVAYELNECWDSLPHFLYDDVTASRLGNNVLASLYAYHKQDRYRRFNIVFLRHSTWSWADQPLAVVLRTISILEQAMSVPVAGSPSGVGMRFLQLLTNANPISKTWLVKPETNLAAIPWNEASKPLVWQRSPTSEELSRKYLYAFDKNAAYPRAAVESEFGIGEPTSCQPVTFDPTLPGIWRVSYTGLKRSAMLPPIVPDEFDWLSTPVVKCLIKNGAEIIVDQAYVFLRHAHIWRGWVNTLWSYRQRSDDLVRQSYKQVMNDTLGLTRSAKLGTNTYKFRPDWNSQMVGEARACMHYNIARYARGGHYPVMCQLDALYYFSDEKSPRNAIQGILDHAESLGGYKLKWCLPVDEKVRAAFANIPAQSLRLQALNELAEGYGY